MGYHRAVHYAAALALTVAQRAAASQPTALLSTGNGLLETCTSSQSGDSGLCLAFIDGVIATTRVLQEAKGARKYICLPDGVTIGQTRDVAIKYLQDHPEQRQNDAVALVVIANMDAFPCRE